MDLLPRRKFHRLVFYLRFNPKMPGRVRARVVASIIPIFSFTPALIFASIFASQLTRRAFDIRVADERYIDERSPRISTCLLKVLHAHTCVYSHLVYCYMDAHIEITEG